MIPAIEELKTTLESRINGLSLTIEGAVLVVPADQLLAVCKHLRAHEPFVLDYLANLTVVDYPPERIELVYHLYSMAQKHGPVALKTSLPRAHPVVASVTPIWRGAEFQEREAYDLFGVIFDGHPDLRRILMWDGFDGHPMRKDYVVEDQDALEERPR